MSHYEIVKPIPSEMLWKDGTLYWADTEQPVDFVAMEQAGYIRLVEDPEVHLIRNGAMTHALTSLTATIRGTSDPIRGTSDTIRGSTDPNEVTCDTCIAEMD